MDDIGFPPLWLRDNCPCAGCRDPASGQKFFGITDLPADVAIASVEWAPDSVVVVFSPDGHRSVFPLGWLKARRHGEGDARAEQAKTLWMGAALQGSDHLGTPGDTFPAFEWERYRRHDAERLRALVAVRGWGFALLRGAPTAEGTVLRVAETFGYVRETNYGRLFDVRAEAQASNLAFTRLAISPHTDNPYRDPVPTMQLLHCLCNTVEGGESVLVDGFRAAADLREQDRESFERLARTSVPFAWSDGRHFLHANRPLVEVNPEGSIRGVRFNNRSMGAVALAPAEATAFYDAYRRFAELVARPHAHVSLRLEAGDCLIFDNTRLLHARRAYAEGEGSPGGRRHLQGCYADLDGLESTIAALEALTGLP
jgi:gamma-butyrobetaine dioxygenase